MMNEKELNQTTEMSVPEQPIWLTDDYKIIEPDYCRAFLAAHPMRCIHGRFYTPDGILPDEGSLKKMIYDEISPWLEAKVAKKVDELTNALKMLAYSEPLPLQFDRIHLSNGTYHLNG